MKYAIITPTYINHFKYIKTYLKSFDKFVEDKKDIPIFFTISKTEQRIFKKIISPYTKKLDLRILYIEDLFAKNNIKESSIEFLTKYGRFTFQTAKKFFTMLSIDADKFLVLDSESMWIKKTNMKQCFDDYFSNPFIVISDIDNIQRTDECFNTMLSNIYTILDMKTEKKWFIEHFMWYYDKKILNKLFADYGTLDEMIALLYKNNENLPLINDLRFGIFEIVLYYAYIYKKNKEFNYNIINVNSELKKHLSLQEYQNYLNYQIKMLHGSCGIIEHTMILANKTNYIKLAQTFKDMKLNIIRCDYSNIKNYNIQKKFLEIVQPVILAASQEHAFGINNVFTTLVKTTKSYTKLCKHFYRWYNPLKNLCSTYIIEPLQTIVHLFPFAVDVLKIIWILYIKRKK